MLFPLPQDKYTRQFRLIHTVYNGYTAAVCFNLMYVCVGVVVVVVVLLLCFFGGRGCGGTGFRRVIVYKHTYAT